MILRMKPDHSNLDIKFRGVLTRGDRSVHKSPSDQNPSRQSRIFLSLILIWHICSAFDLRIIEELPPAFRQSDSHSRHLRTSIPRWLTLYEEGGQYNPNKAIETVLKKYLHFLILHSTDMTFQNGELENHQKYPE